MRPRSHIDGRISVTHRFFVYAYFEQQIGSIFALMLRENDLPVKSRRRWCLENYFPSQLATAPYDLIRVYLHQSLPLRVVDSESFGDYLWPE